MLKVVQKEVKFTKVVYYGHLKNPKLPPKIRMYCDITDEVYDPVVGDNNLFIFDLPEDDVRVKLRDRPDRWRLYGETTKPLYYQSKNGTGSTKWILEYPWVSETKNVLVGRDGDKDVYQYKIIWTQLTADTVKKKL